MEGLKIKILESKILVQPLNTIVSGGKNQFECYFEFSDEWLNANKTAVFENEETVIHVLIKDDKCIIPDEVLKEKFSLSVLGIVEEDVIYSTNQARILVYDGSKNDSGEIPTPDIFQQYILEMNELVVEAQQVNSDVNIIKEEILQVQKDIQTDNENLKNEVDKIVSDGIQDITNNSIAIKSELNQIATSNVNQMNQIKTETDSIKNEALTYSEKIINDGIKQIEDIKLEVIEEAEELILNSEKDLNEIKKETEDIRDVALDYMSQIYFPTFEIDIDSGNLIMNNAEKLANAGFYINEITGDLEVIVSG